MDFDCHLPSGLPHIEVGTNSVFSLVVIRPWLVRRAMNAQNGAEAAMLDPAHLNRAATDKGVHEGSSEISSPLHILSIAYQVWARATVVAAAV